MRRSKLMMCEFECLCQLSFLSKNCSLIKLMEWSAEAHMAQMAHEVTRGSN